MYKEYKANRKGMPEELAMQMPIIKEILIAMNIKIIEKEGFNKILAKIFPPYSFNAFFF